MVRIGIIGMGMMGRTHYEGYAKLPNAQVTAICDINPKRAAGDLSGTTGNLIAGSLMQLPMDRIAGMADYRDLIKRSDVDVVDICTPTPLHAEMVIAALETGKHVLSEKPLARTLSEAERIAKAAAGAKGFHMPAMCIRFWPEWAWLKEAVADRRYGAVQSASFRRLATPLSGWFARGAESGGAILDLHVHDVDYVNYLFGRPDKVYTRGHKGYTGEIDHLMTQYTYKDVLVVTTEAGWCMGQGFPFRMQFLVNFERATAEYDLSSKEPLVIYQGGKKEAIACRQATGYEAELEYFVNCIDKSQRPTIVTAADGLTALKIVDAEKRSVISGAVEAVAS